MAAIWFVPALTLLAAPLHLPYGYYTFLRLLVCITAVVIAYWSWPKHGIWTVALGVVALLFNPLIIVALDRQTWAPIDVGVAIIYLAHWFFVGRKVSVRR